MNFDLFAATNRHVRVPRLRRETPEAVLSNFETSRKVFGMQELFFLHDETLRATMQTPHNIVTP